MGGWSAAQWKELATQQTRLSEEAPSTRKKRRGAGRSEPVGEVPGGKLQPEEAVQAAPLQHPEEPEVPVAE